MTDDDLSAAARDDDLRARLVGADPAASLPAADPAGVARLLEDTMSQTPETRSDHLRHRSRLTWVIAAAAAVVIVGGVAFAIGTGDDNSPELAGDAPTVVDPSSTAPDGEESVTELTITSNGTSGRCLTPEAAPQVVSSQSLVVDATVESISAGVVTLAPTRFYTGEETDLVTVSEPSGDLQLLLAGVEFEEGGRYLVSATDGQVTLCRFSGPYSERLAAVYDDAFSG